MQTARRAGKFRTSVFQLLRSMACDVLCACQTDQAQGKPSTDGEGCAFDSMLPLPHHPRPLSVAQANMADFEAFAQNNLILVLAWVGLLAALIWNEISRMTSGFKEIDPSELTALINHGEALVVDVSPLKDYEAGHILGSKHVFFSQLDPQAKDLAAHREKPLALYCQSGMQARQAAAKLVKAGFTQVKILRGGLGAWRAENLPVSRRR